jgi:hypothetical protein
MTDSKTRVLLGFATGALLGLVMVLPAFAGETERFNVEGLDTARGPFVGQVELIPQGRDLQVVRTIRFRAGGKERLSGKGQRKGTRIRAQLLRAAGARGVLVGQASSQVELRLVVDRGGRCRTRCFNGARTLSRGHGALPGRELTFLSNLEPKGAGKAKKGDHLQREHFVERFEGVPFVRGKGDRVQIDGNDPEQGALGDCYLVAAMIAVARSDPGVIRRMITAGRGGKYTVRLHGLGSWGTDKVIALDDTFPSLGKGRMKNLAYASSSDRRTVKEKTLYELWPSLIEKAYAQHKGGFAKIKGGHSDGPFEFFSGKPASSYYTFFRSGSDLAKLIRNARAKGYPVCVGMKNDTGALGRKLSVTGCHVYVLWGVKGGRYQLYNPWQSGHPSRPVTASELGKLASHIYVGEF